MPRDANGNYTLPAGNPVVTDTDIASNWANSTMQDLATEITDSLSRSGKGGITGPFQIIDKSGSIPGLAFANEPTSGLKREALGDVRVQIQGNDRMRWRAGASQVPEVQVAGVWKEVAVLEASRKVMQGVGGETTLWFYNATVPAAAGWSLDNPDANVRSLMVGGTGGTIAGSDDPAAVSYPVSVSLASAAVGITGNVAGTAITVAQMPPHTHPIKQRVFDGTGNEPKSGNTGSSSATNATTESTGSGEAHDHGVGSLAGTVTDSTSTGTATATPRYAMGVFGKLDA